MFGAGAVNRLLDMALVAFVLLGLMFLAAAPSPVHADEPQCRYNLTDTRVTLMTAEVPHAVLAWNDRDHFVAMLESALGFNFPAVSNVLIARLPQGVFYGLEIGGCLTAPALLVALPPQQLSGATPAGVFA